MSGRLPILPLLGVLALFACTNDPFDPDSVPNERPVARIFVDPADSLAVTSYNGARFAWSGSDADGFVVGFWVSITTDRAPDAPWVFTVSDDSVATWTTNEDGTVSPTLHVVAVDDRGALSDTARVAFPLVNTPPVLEFGEEFEPPATSIRAADFDFFTFDSDGDDTLLPIVEYRYDGSDPGVTFAVDDTLADATVGWVAIPRTRRGFRLRLRDLPGGDPANENAQTVYVRVRDIAGASTVLDYTWTVPEVRGSVLLVDDDPQTSISREAFFEGAMDAHFGDQWTTIESTSLQGEPEVLAASIEPFDTIIWYVGRQTRGQNLNERRELVTNFVNGGGKFYLDFQYAGTSQETSLLDNSFRVNVLGVAQNPIEGIILGPLDVANQIGPFLDIQSESPSLPDLLYLPASGTFFGVQCMGLTDEVAPLYQFELARWIEDPNRSRLIGPTEPVVGVRKPSTGEAQVVTMTFQIELTLDPAIAQQVLRSIWSDVMGIPALVEEEAR